MKQLIIITILIGLALCTPSFVNFKNAKDEKNVVVGKNYFPDKLKIYTAKHDIVSIVVPLNDLNDLDGYEDDEEEDESDDHGINDNDDDDDGILLFFVEADIKDGIKDYKGLSVIKDKQAKKLLETGTDASADNDDSKTAYFSATDGLYIYNEKENKAEKYGSVTDNLISLAKVNASDLIYILTANNEVYKVTNNGTKKEKVDEIVGAQQIVLDFSNNLYYYDNAKQVYVLNQNGLTKIEGLPPNPSYINIVKPPFAVESGVPIIVNNKAHFIYENGTSEPVNVELEVMPTAYSMETILIEYLAYDKNIYEYNILAILESNLLRGLAELLNIFGNILYIPTKIKSSTGA